MGRFKAGGKPDANQGEIVKALRRAGAYVLIISLVRDSFDVIVYFRGKTYSVEIKDGSLPPSKRQLRKGENYCRIAMELTGVKYWVINSIDEALTMINLKQLK